MLSPAQIHQKLDQVFDRDQADVLAEVIQGAYSDLVKTSDFSELKSIVLELAEAQKRTEAKVGELAEAQKSTEAKMGELAEAQKRTEAKMGELAEAQKRTDGKMGSLAEAQERTEAKIGELAEAQKSTEAKMGELAEAQRRTEKEVRTLAQGLNETRSELGGLSRSVGYALENEAYRLLPGLLEARRGLRVTRRLVRGEVAGEEVNILGEGTLEGRPVWIVGEAKLRLGDRSSKAVFAQLNRKVAAVRAEKGDVEVVPVLVTHYATKRFLEEAERLGVVVLQSFEW